MSTTPSGMQKVGTHITSEYLEMPRLALTRPQATHLWNVDLESGARVLDRLVSCGVVPSAGGT